MMSETSPEAFGATAMLHEFAQYDWNHMAAAAPAT
jgi:hypothetical protein